MAGLDRVHVPLDGNRIKTLSPRLDTRESFYWCPLSSTGAPGTLGELYAKRAMSGAAG